MLTLTQVHCIWMHSLVGSFGISNKQVVMQLTMEALNFDLVCFGV